MHYRQITRRRQIGTALSAFDSNPVAYLHVGVNFDEEYLECARLDFEKPQNNEP
jgi:hypothetical protein